MSDCKGSRAISKRINITNTPVGQRIAILEHGPCGCCSGCRRVALWHPTPTVDFDVEGGSNWILKAIARVSFGDDCPYGPEVEVDWKHGVILDLMGCFTAVTFEIVEKSGTFPEEEFLYGVLSACCGAGGARGCATRTLPVTLLAGSGPTAIKFFKIPPFAYAVSFATPQGEFLFTADTTFYQFGSGITTTMAKATGDIVPDPWMLIGGAEYIGIEPTIVDEGTIQVEPVFLIGV